MKFLAPVGGVTQAHGIITAPNHKGIPADIKAGKPWAADLGCLDGPDYIKRIDFDKTLAWLETMKPYRDQCLFIAGADIVGDAVATLDAYEEFYRYFEGWPLAYCVQNGAEHLAIPETATAIFLGGDTEYKESMAAVSVIKRAQRMGKHIHIGRINWGRRYRLFRMLTGSDDFTCDGTRVRWDGTANTIAAWRQLEQQPPLITL